MITAMVRRFLLRIYEVFSRRWFFWVIVAIFVFEAAWIALSSLYPMAFDEDFHLGVIKLYVDHPSPFWPSQPSGANSFGSIATDPSYFYHFLMSFPYRFVSIFTDNQTTIVLWLRAINVALFAAALPVWHRVMRKMGASPAMTHSILLFFVLLPIVPLLAGQINYDNLLFLLIALVSLQTITVLESIKKSSRLLVVDILSLLCLCLLAALVKYAFLPIFVVVLVAVMLSLWRQYHGFSKIWRTIKPTRISLSISALLVLFVVLAGLFIQRDITNLVRYHTPAPSCDAVLSIEECAEYGPWNRDYILANTKTASPHNPFAYSYEWFYGMWERSLFAVAGPTANFATRGPLTAPAYTAIIVAFGMVVCMIIKGRSVWRSSSVGLKFMLSMVAVYVLVLWLDGFEAYTRTGKPVAINGRYLLVILLPLAVFAGLCLSSWLGNRRALKTGLACLAIIGMLWGGGLLTFILRSDQAWYWSNHTVVMVNQHVRETLGPIIPGYRSPTQFLR